MLRNKGTTIISDLSDFFTSSEKAIGAILSTYGAIRVCAIESHLDDKCNNMYKNINKLFLLLLFPFFDVANPSRHKQGVLYPAMRCGKDAFYRLMNNSLIDWRRIGYQMTLQLIGKARAGSGNDNGRRTRCLIIDDTVLPKTGMKIELISRVFSHSLQSSILGFKGLFMGYHDGVSFFGIDFSLHGEKGKNKKRPYGLSKAQLKERFSKERPKGSASLRRTQEHAQSKIDRMIEMVRQAIANGLRFDYVLVDSWFTCHELVSFVKSRRIGCHLLAMAKMGTTKYSYKEKELNAKQMVDSLRRAKKIRRSKALRCYCAEAEVGFQGHRVKLFFCKASRQGKWHMLMTTDLALCFEDAYRTYCVRWTIEVFFKDSKQLLRLGKCQSQDFDAQIASTTVSMIQHNVLCVARRFRDYESLGGIFRNSNAETLQLTVAQKIWQLILETISEIAQILDIDIENLMEKLIAENEQIAKLSKYNSLLNAS